MIKIYYDLETTGVDPRKNGIHQMSFLIEQDNELVRELNMKVRPRDNAIYEPEALKIGGVTEEAVREYPDMKRVYNKLILILAEYMDRYDRKDKAYLVGFNNRSFDDIFFRRFFEDNGDTYFGSWFWTDSLDVMVLASQYLIDRRTSMSSFKLKRVATELGLDVEEEKLHDAFYDVQLTRQIYRIVTGLDFEI